MAVHVLPHLSNPSWASCAFRGGTGPFLELNMDHQNDIHLMYQELQHCCGDRAEVLSKLNRMCIAGRYNGDTAAQGLLVAAQGIFANREESLAWSAAHGLTSWPGSFGQSPFGEVFALLRIALAGHVPLASASPAERAIHAAVFDRIAPPAAVARVSLTEQGRSRRYGRLLLSMRQTAMLTHTEADATLRQLLARHPRERGSTLPSCEAVANFGGNMRVLTEVLRRRPHLRVMRSGAAAST